MAKGDIHSLGLGLIKQITNQVENDTNISGIYDAIEPVAKDMMQEYFPTQMVEIHPLVNIAWKLFNRNKLVDEKTISIKDISK